METTSNGMPDHEDLDARQENASASSQSGYADGVGKDFGLNPENDDARQKRKHHDDHHINRKYRVFSNHSSYGDSPHTNTSI